MNIMPLKNTSQLSQAFCHGLAAIDFTTATANNRRRILHFSQIWLIFVTDK